MYVLEHFGSVGDACYHIGLDHFSFSLFNAHHHITTVYIHISLKCTLQYLVAMSSYKQRIKLFHYLVPHSGIYFLTNLIRNVPYIPIFQQACARAMINIAFINVLLISHIYFTSIYSNKYFIASYSLIMKQNYTLFVNGRHIQSNKMFVLFLKRVGAQHNVASHQLHDFAQVYPPTHYAGGRCFLTDSAYKETARCDLTFRW